MEITLMYKLERERDKKNESVYYVCLCCVGVGTGWVLLYLLHL